LRRSTIIRRNQPNDTRLRRPWLGMQICQAYFKEEGRYPLIQLSCARFEHDAQMESPE
jgi:hypothetical protein